MSTDNDIAVWYRSIPPITRYWFTGSVVVPLLGKLGLIDNGNLFLIWPEVFYNFQIWRPFTALFVFYTGWEYLVNLYLLYKYSKLLEEGLFLGLKADYAYMLTVIWASAAVSLAFESSFTFQVTGLLIPFALYTLMSAEVRAALYVWCMVHQNETVTFWFGTYFKAGLLPWVMLAFDYIIETDWVSCLVGILAGHVYYFLRFKYPQDYGGPSLIHTPQIFYRWFPRTRSHGFGSAPNSRRTEDDDANGHRWGVGQTLGQRRR